MIDISSATEPSLLDLIKPTDFDLLGVSGTYAFNISNHCIDIKSVKLCKVTNYI
jgi:hypothetical protein